MTDFPSHVRGRWLVLATLAPGLIVADLCRLVPSMWPLLGVCAFVASYNLALQLNRHSQAQHRGTLMGALLLDIAALTVLLYSSGDLRDSLYLAYVLPVIAGTTLLRAKAGFALSACAVGLFSIVLFLTADARAFEAGVAQVAVLALAVGFATWAFARLGDRVRRNERTLREDNERLVLLLDTLPDGVVLMSADGATVANAVARQFTQELGGCAVDALPGRLGLSERVARFAGPIEEFETSHDGRTLTHVLARRSPEGPIVWVLRDTTERRRLMAQVMHHSKMSDLGLLAAGIAHEIGNPLSSMSAIIDLLEIKRAVPEERARLAALSGLVNRINRIIRDVTGFARPSTEARTRHRLSALLDKALRIFRLHERSRQVEVDVVPWETDALVSVVDDQIVQVFFNLLLNAADAGNRTGTIVVALDCAPDEVRLAFMDHGCGMTDEQRLHLFSPFFTTKQPGEGIGLGLFVSESILRAHGGRIDVESTPGRGSTFTVCLPRTAHTRETHATRAS